MSTPVNLRGRLTRDPELRYSAAGKAVAKFSVVTSRRYKDDSGNWVDKDTTFWDCVAFGQLAENIAESLPKGTAVILAGNAAQEEWTTKEGDKRRSIKVMVDDVAPSLRWASAKVGKSERTAPAAPAADDPWAGGSADSSSTYSDTPPF
jgi:single-strand DNA-binding protein